MVLVGGPDATLCVHLSRTNAALAVGDTLWWQGRYVYWTPRPLRGREDVKLLRVGYSHDANECWPQSLVPRQGRTPPPVEPYGGFPG